MPHSVSLLAVENRSRSGEILAALATHLDVPAIHPDDAGFVQLWLPLDGSAAEDKIIAALDLTANDWREHIGLR